MPPIGIWMLEMLPPLCNGGEVELRNGFQLKGLFKVVKLGTTNGVGV